MKIRSENLFAIAVLATFFLAWRKKNPDHYSDRRLTIQFRTVVGSKSFCFDSSYTNAFGETFNITKFKYYVSNIELGNSVTGNKTSMPPAYFLVNEADSSSKKISLSIPRGIFDRLYFLVGVDSLKNVSGAQGGALDPANDMFWTWNTGYVMAKLEGTSPASKQIHHAIEYHIGGFRGNNKVLRKIELTIPGPGTATADLKLTIRADINAWFQGSHNLSIADDPVCTSPGVLAKEFSENYAGMFSIWKE